MEDVPEGYNFVSGDEELTMKLFDHFDKFLKKQINAFTRSDEETLSLFSSFLVAHGVFVGYLLGKTLTEDEEYNRHNKKRVQELIIKGIEIAQMEKLK